MPTLRLGSATDRSGLVKQGNGVPHRFQLGRAGPAPSPQGQGRRPATIDADTVIARLDEAGCTLLSLPGNDPAIDLAQARLRTVAGIADGRRPRPDAARTARMDQAFGWIALVPADKLMLRRIVGCRALVSPRTGRHLFSWTRLGRLLNTDAKVVRRWHALGIGIIVATLNRDAAFAMVEFDQGRCRPGA